MSLAALTPEQDRTIRYGLKHPYSILAAGAGLGKTRIIIEIKERTKSKCLVIAPAYLIDNWVLEIEKWSPRKQKIMRIKKGTDIKTPKSDVDYVIMSYDMAKKADIVFEWAGEKNRVVALEEVHNVKSMKAQRTQAIHKSIYENGVTRLHMLTGTPIKNRVEEWYSLVALSYYHPNEPSQKFLDKFPDSITFADYFSFRHEYTIPVSNRFLKVVKWTGLRNVKELKNKWLKKRYIRIPPKDYGVTVFEDIHISTEPDLDLLKAFESEIDGAMEAVTDREGQVTGYKHSTNPRAKAAAALAKVPFTIKRAEAVLEETDCVLIYSDHVEASEAIAKHFKVPALNGNIPPEKRMELARRFQDGEGQVLVATIKALSEGVTLTRANHMIINDYPWVPGDLEQMRRRINRLGQTKSCVYHRMIGSPQDEKIMATIEEKLKVINKAT